MHRSSSTSRNSDEFVISLSPQVKGSPGLKMSEMDQLPIHDPLSEVSKKEASRLRSAENAVHLIPVAVLLCVFILWYFSHPAVDLSNKGATVATTVEGLKLDDNVNWNDSSFMDVGAQQEIVERAVLADAAKESARMSSLPCSSCS